MDPARKRSIRLVVALSAAVVLATLLIWTSFSASSESKTPSQLLSATPGATYQLTGKVAAHSWVHRGEVNTFRVRDRGSSTSVPVRYTGAVPDPFREGREIVVKVRKQGDTWVGVKDTLVTKCPSKFATKAPKT